MTERRIRNPTLEKPEFVALCQRHFASRTVNPARLLRLVRQRSQPSVFVADWTCRPPKLKLLRLDEGTKAPTEVLMDRIFADKRVSVLAVYDFETKASAFHEDLLWAAEAMERKDYEVLR